MARVLSLSGATLPANMLPPQVDNPKGFWEPKEVVVLNDRLLAEADSAWDDVFAFEAKPFAALVTEQNKEDAACVLRTAYGDAANIILKDPRISLLTPLWDQVMRAAAYDPLYVIMVRNPLEVAASLRARSAFIKQKSLLLWLSYMLSAERNTRLVRRIFISYEQLLEHPQDVLMRISSIDRRLLVRQTQTASNEIEAFLESELRRHHYSRSDLVDRESVWPVVRDVEKWFGDAANGHESPSQSLDDATDRMADVFKAVGSVVADLRAGIGQLSTRVTQLTQVAVSLKDDSRKIQDELEANREEVDHLRVIAADIDDARADKQRLQDNIAHLGEACADEKTRLEQALRQAHHVANERQDALDESDAARMVIADGLRRLEQQAAEQHVALEQRAAEQHVAYETYSTELANLRESLEHALQTAAQRLAAYEAGEIERLRLQDALTLANIQLDIAILDWERLSRAQIGWRQERSALMGLVTFHQEAGARLERDKENLTEHQERTRQHHVSLLQDLRKELLGAQTAQVDLRSELKVSYKDVKQLVESRSWRLTKPLRLASGFVWRLVH